MLTLRKELDGTILDIGGGGEGIMGRLYTDQVTAIDKRQDELDEAPDVCQKLLMDATALRFESRAFDHVTSFYTLMFMDSEEQRQAILEAARVLKRGGMLHIWDCDIASAWPEPFCIDLEIELPDVCITTTYGVGKLGRQSLDSIKQMCLGSGLSIAVEIETEYGFYLRFQKGD